MERRRSGRATTSLPPAFSLATSRPGRRAGIYQSTPHDLYDHDDINEIVLVDWPAPNGQRIPALIRPSRNGYFYVQDRRNGRILSVDAYSYINAYKASI